VAEELTRCRYASRPRRRRKASAKEKGRDNFQFYAAGMNAPAQEVAVLQGELSAAL
jgi:hypothetical protein